MSSRNQTQSLDRNFYRSKRKIKHSQNIEKINNNAERVVCHFHKQIEDIFSKYPVKRFSEELSIEKLLDVIENLERKCRLDNEDLLKTKTTLKDSFGDDLLVEYMDFVIESKTLLRGINSSLSNSIRHGLIEYCLSLADYCTSEINFVINYERVIKNNSADIIKEIEDISGVYRNFRIHLSDSRSVLHNCAHIIDCVGRIRACINKLYYLVTEWVDEERNYPQNLAEEMKSIKSQIFNVQQRITANKDSISTRQTKLMNLDKHLKIIMKNANILKRKYRQIEYSQEQIDFKMRRLTAQESSRDSEMLILTRKLKFLKENPNNISSEMRVTSNEQRELQSKQYRLEDTKLALHRHRERLYKASNDFSERIELSLRDITLTRKLRNKLQLEIKEDTEVQNNDMETLKKLLPIMEDLNFLTSKKYAPETLRQIRFHGKLMTEKKDNKVMEKICDHIVQTVADDWRDIYLNVPFYPDRSIEQRSNDIMVIDQICARNDFQVEKQAKTALNKWRLFYHNATPEHLITGLKKSRLFEAAKEVQDLYVRSKSRYEDEC